MPWCYSCKKVFGEGHFYPDGSCEGDRDWAASQQAWEDWYNKGSKKQGESEAKPADISPELKDNLRKRLQEYAGGGKGGCGEPN